MASDFIERTNHSYRVAALTSQNHMTSYFHKAKEHGIQGQLNGRYCITYTPGHVAVQFNQHGNCTTATVATLMLGMLRDNRNIGS